MNFSVWASLFSRLRGRISTQLLIVFFGLVLVTTLSAGTPAYLITRSQLEQQTWLYVISTQHAINSLLQAEQAQLANLTTLFTERPTLQRLLQEKDQSGLSTYLQAFQEQSQLDILRLCLPEVIQSIPVLDLDCESMPAEGFILWQQKPALIVRRLIVGDESGEELGTAIAGIFLDSQHLTQLANATGGVPTILTQDGQRLSSALSLDKLDSLVIIPTNRSQLYRLSLNEELYYATSFSLSDETSEQPLQMEVALSVTNLHRTETRALTILVASTGLVGLFAVALGVWYIRRLLEPLQQLTTVAEQISYGDFQVTMPAFSHPPEITTLASALEKSQTSMLQALTERSQARDWLNSLIQSIVEGVVTFDTKGHITFLSQGAENLLGWTQAEAIGQPIHHIFRMADAQEGSFYRQMPPAGQKRQMELLTRTGKTLTLAVTGSRLVPPNGDTVQVALVLRDVTEEEARQHLRSYFLSNITHEFRTPLSTLNASIELLLNEGENLSASEMRELLKPTHLSLLGLQTLVDNLLESSIIEAGRFILRKNPVQIEKVVADAIRIVHPLLERRQQLLVVNKETDLPTIEADEGRLVQVLVNLLGNAGKYSPIGCQIAIKLSCSPPSLRIEVVDQGPGISLSEQANLFQRFVRLARPDPEQYGIGLGLYVVKTAIEAHGGQVGVESRPQGGSVFWLELPTE